MAASTSISAAQPLRRIQYRGCSDRWWQWPRSLHDQSISRQRRKESIYSRTKTIHPSQVAAELNQDTVIRIQCDATDQSALKAAVAHIEAETGYINLLIANSGSVPLGSSITELQETLYNIPMQDLTNTFHVNGTAVFYTTVAFLGLLDAGNRNGSYCNGRRQVIATSSIAGFNRRISAGFAYSTSKAATTMMMKVLATYLVLYRFGRIFFVLVFPTDLTTGLYQGENPTEEGAFPLDQIPAERAGMPEDIMGPLLYLASRAGAYCNGNCVLTDGGRLSVMPAIY